MLTRLIAAAVLTVGLCSSHVTFAQAPSQLVAPESLPQGFILVVKDNSGLSSTTSPLYLACNWSGWAPGDAAFKLIAQSDMRWRIIVKKPKPDSPGLQFKITRGSWDQCEVSSDLSDIQNRTLSPIDASKLKPGEQPVIEITVERFSDQRPDSQAKKAVDPYRTINATGTVKRITVVGGGVPGPFRDAIVWLPPRYGDPANATRSYPVLYLQDGQNLFESVPGGPAEWGVDETATKLIAAGKMAPVIIVAIPHSGADRMSEYMPVSGVGELQPGGDAYVRFLTNEVIPRVERAFRVRADAAHRGIGGSSMGGLISLYAAARHPEVFGVVLAESPTLLLGKREIWRELFSDVKVWPGRIAIGMGTRETGSDAEVSGRYVQAARDLDAAIGKAGVSESQRRLTIDEGATHNEAAWGKRLADVMTFLFPPEDK